jgi:alkyldihydroxyacetonephosphate synthase
MTTPTAPSSLPGSQAPRPRLGPEAEVLDEALLVALRGTGAPLRDGLAERAEAGRDWWPLSIGWAAEDLVSALPALIARPTEQRQVAALVAVCNAWGLPVTAAGGRSGVSGGAVPATGGLVLDLTGLDRIIEIDERSLLVTAEAGVFGPELEDALRSTGSGYTLGHWPQSFELSTVGGWLACRGAGQYSTRYGKIEDMVRALRVTLADGREVRTGGAGPRAAVGPDLNQLFVGSEGTLGIITEATLAIHPVPQAEAHGAWRPASFDEGLDACRRILRRGATPAVLRLYDEVEAERNFDVDGCLLLVLDEADPSIAQATMSIIVSELAGVEALDVALVERWRQHRNDVSQLAPLWAAGIVVDTIEMAGTWTQLPEVRRRVLGALESLEQTIVASVHQSHAYTDGACLYFTFAGQPAIEEREDYYRRCWDLATAEILACGAAISHHHGIGLNRARFMAEALGAGFSVLSDVKAALDPRGILNPAKLGLGPASEVPW